MPVRTTGRSTGTKTFHGPPQRPQQDRAGANRIGTSDAEASARRSSRRITLIDGEGLLDLWVEHYRELDEEARELLPIKPVYFLDLDAADV